MNSEEHIFVFEVKLTIASEPILSDDPEFAEASAKEDLAFLIRKLLKIEPDSVETVGHEIYGAITEHDESEVDK